MRCYCLYRKLHRASPSATTCAGSSAVQRAMHRHKSTAPKSLDIWPIGYDWQTRKPFGEPAGTRVVMSEAGPTAQGSMRRQCLQHEPSSVTILTREIRTKMYKLSFMMKRVFEWQCCVDVDQNLPCWRSRQCVTPNWSSVGPKSPVYDQYILFKCFFTRNVRCASSLA